MNKYVALIIIVVVLSILVTACDLKRINPLDPVGNPDINIPDRVVGLSVLGSGPGIQSKYVELKWKRNVEVVDSVKNTDGYFIYMGLAYNSAYERVGWTSNVAADSIVTKIIPIQAPGYYYFKVSAIKYYGNDPSMPDPIEDSSEFLEGQLSEYKLAHVQN